MNFDEFWRRVSQGGTAPMKRGGLVKYSIIVENGKEKLKIKSSNSDNDRYYILKETTEQYFNDPDNTNHSWFNSVYRELSK